MSLSEPSETPALPLQVAEPAWDVPTQPNQSPPTDSTAALPLSRYTVGTLSYTTAGLVALFVWLLWGDFCLTIMETIIPSILPLKLQSLKASSTLMAVLMSTLPN